jgi:hypothetical protein
MSEKKKIIFKKKKPDKYKELNYDIVNNVSYNVETINYELVNKIIALNNSKLLDNIDCLKSKKTKKIITKLSNTFYDEDTVDTESLVEDLIGGKQIFYDYDKNIIYNSSYNIIGSIMDNDIEFYDTSYIETNNNINDVSDEKTLENKIDLKI